MAFGHTLRPIETPWGAPYDAEQILPGLWRVSTASHGGLLVSEARHDAMPASLRLEGRAFEEDIDWSLAILAFEAEYRVLGRELATLDIALAHDTARVWHSERYGAFTGTPVSPSESHVLRTRAAYQALIGEIVVVSAYGDWADWVPTGKTGIIGREVAGVDHLGHARFAGADQRALVDAEAYRAALSPVSFAALAAEPFDWSDDRLPPAATKEVFHV